MKASEDSKGYEWSDADLNESHSYLLPKLYATLELVQKEYEEIDTLFDLGCGNGSVANALSQHGWRVTGVDSSELGIKQANEAYPALKLFRASAYDDLFSRFGRYPVVISLEVVEHVYYPKKYADTLFSLVEPGGFAIVSTPFHGYWKNLALALSGTMDRHFTALWEHGHIKFWSEFTLATLLNSSGFADIRFERVGRIAPLAKSMIAICRKPK
ncbi:MAG: class I SAM-dependent methyltransferase [Cyanobacteria bacterium P01_F01_bin.3]